MIVLFPLHKKCLPFVNYCRWNAGAICRNGDHDCNILACPLTCLMLMCLPLFFQLHIHEPQPLSGFQFHQQPKCNQAQHPWYIPEEDQTSLVIGWVGSTCTSTFKGRRPHSLNLVGMSEEEALSPSFTDSVPCWVPISDDGIDMLAQLLVAQREALCCSLFRKCQNYFFFV